jgi:hypothetical protein
MAKVTVYGIKSSPDAPRLVSAESAGESTVRFDGKEVGRSWPAKRLPVRIINSTCNVFSIYAFAPGLTRIRKT